MNGHFASRTFVRQLSTALICLLGLFSLAGEAEETPLEYQVKAAFLLNFTKFAEWQENAFADEHSPLAVCVFGDDPFGSALDQVVEGETAGRRKITLAKMKQPPAPKQCQVLFISNTVKDVQGILSATGPGVLTVGEGDAFLRDGGAIAFVIDNRRVRFDIDQTAAEKAQVKLSSRLLRVARTVEK